MAGIRELCKVFPLAGTTASVEKDWSCTENAPWGQGLGHNVFFFFFPVKVCPRLRFARALTQTIFFYDHDFHVNYCHKRVTFKENFTGKLVKTVIMFIATYLNLCCITVMQECTFSQYNWTVHIQCISQILTCV